MTNTISRVAICLAIAASPFGLFAAPAHTTTYVTEAAKETLSDDFPRATNVDWRDGQAPDVYTAYFTVNGVKVTANVDRDGTLLSVLRYYDGGKVPGRIRNLLTTQFPDRTIDGVTEYTDNTGDDTAPQTIQATMEDSGHVYTVTLEGHKAKTIQTMDKQ
jgi:hypothetical protein